MKLPKLSPRLKRIIKQLLLALVGLCTVRAVWFGWKHFGPGQPIVISRANTFIVEPLDAGKLPDYYEFLRRKLSEQITPQNNAVALLSQVAGTRNLSVKHRRQYFEELGVPLPAGKVNWFIPLVQEKQLALEQTSQFPWAPDAAPELEEWLNKHQASLDLACQASRRPRFYSPLIGHEQKKGGRPALISVLLPMQAETQQLAEALCMRAMKRLHDGQLKRSQEDLLAAARLNRLLANRSFLVSLSLAYDVEDHVMGAFQSLLASAKLDALAARSILDSLQELQSLPPVSESLNPYDRLMVLDSLMSVKRYGINTLSGTNPQDWDWVDWVRMDYNIVLRDMNRWFDQLDNVAMLRNRQQRRDAWDRIDKAINQVANRSLQERASSEARLDIRRRSQVVSDIFVSLMLPDIRPVLDKQDRVNTQFNLTRITAALAVYRSEQGEYPEQLTNLIPAVLPKLPIDLYSGKPFLYQRKNNDGYLLYSVYENEVDDRGKSINGDIIAGEWVDETPEGFDYEECDLVIRVPGPAFKFPELSAD